MKKICTLIFIIALTILSALVIFADKDQGSTAGLSLAQGLRWHGQAAFSFQAQGKTIYIDPFRLQRNDRADIILITHCHQDHFSLPDIKRISTPGATLVIPHCLEASSEKELKGLGLGIVRSKPGWSAKIAGLSIEGVPAYTIVKTHIHPMTAGLVGYILTINGIRLYHVGDSERIPEMKKLTADIILVPLGQTYTMQSVEDAAQAVLDVKATIAIPMHFGMYEGTQEDAQKFKQLLGNKVTVIIKKPE